VTLDGNPGTGTNSGLKLGMVVKATGSFNGNTGTATSVEYRDNLEGPVCTPTTPINSPINGIVTLRVLGQTVILDATTIVDKNDQINFNDIVEVSGLPNELEQIQASFVEVKNSATLIEVKGFVDDVDDNMKVLTINALDVDYSGPGVIDTSIPGGVPIVGQFVEVKGLATDFTCGSGVNDTLTATKIELEPEGAGTILNGDHAEIEGFITELTSNGFKFGNREVVTTGNTRYLPEGFLAGNIQVGAKVEAEGTYANGMLTATKIAFHENVRLESDIATGNANSFTLAGLPNLIITTNNDTFFDFPRVSFNSGVSHIRVRGIEGPNDTVLATRIDDKTGNTDIFLQGPVDGISGADVTILEVSVDTNLIPDPNFQDIDEIGISRATFLGLVQPGTLVKFKGDLLSGVTPIIWDEAELEDD